jgi:hypothetical protein
LSAGATAGGGDQADLWVLDLGSALLALGGRLPAGATITNQTVSIVPGNRLAGVLSLRAGMAELVKANLGHGIYALPQDPLPPTLSVAGETDADELPPAQVGEAWSAQIEAFAAQATHLYWQLLDAPTGVSLTPLTATDSDAGTQAIATLNWTPTAGAAAASEIRVRVEDSRGGFAWRRFRVAVAGGNHAPTFEPIEEFTLKEGETLALPLRAADADGDHLTQIIRNLPPGATFDAARGLLTWTPGYDQAGSGATSRTSSATARRLRAGTWQSLSNRPTRRRYSTRRRYRRCAKARVSPCNSPASCPGGHRPMAARCASNTVRRGCRAVRRSTPRPAGWRGRHPTINMDATPYR